jgi:hypothetical protein
LLKCFDFPPLGSRENLCDRILNKVMNLIDLF